MTYRYCFPDKRPLAVLANNDCPLSVAEAEVAQGCFKTAKALQEEVGWLFRSSKCVTSTLEPVFSSRSLT